MIIKKCTSDDTIDHAFWDDTTCVFSHRSWTENYDGRLVKFNILSDKGRLLGGFVAFEGGRSFAKTLITPPFAPNIGLFFKSEKSNPSLESGERKQVAQAIAGFLRSSEYVYFKLDFPVEWTDMQPYVWSGLTVAPRYTYRLNLETKGNSWIEDADPKLRNMIEKARKEGFRVMLRDGDDELLQRVLGSLNDKGVKYDHQMLNKLMRHPQSRILQLYKNDLVVYTSVFWISRGEAYYLLAHYNKDAGSNAISAFGLYSVIQYCIEQSCRIFDFEGSMIPGVEKFFRSFGGELIPYYSVSGGKFFWPWLFRWKQKNGR